MKRFIIVSHTGDPRGEWGLSEIAGDAGRIDVLCRNVSSALFLSYGVRTDVEVYLCFVSSPVRERTVRISGATIRNLNPDERSTAARIKTALRATGSIPGWKEVEPGLAAAPFGLAELLADLRPSGTLLLLDPKGTPLRDAPLPPDPLFVLSDHRAFTVQEYALLDAAVAADSQKEAARVSLGPLWYHGNHVISVVHHEMDLRGIGTHEARRVE